MSQAETLRIDTIAMVKMYQRAAFSRIREADGCHWDTICGFMGILYFKFVGSLDRRIEGFIAYVTTTAVAEGHS